MNRWVLSTVVGALVFGGCAKWEPNEELVVPLDDRPVTRSSVRPPPISGGTLAVLADHETVVAADPDRDRVVIVGLTPRSVLHEVRLEPGDEPGRVTEGPSRTAFVVLRGADAVATIDVDRGLVLARRAVCAAPRGIAYDAALDQLHVACASGSLLTFDGGAETPSRTLDLGADLRDVVLSTDRLLVTRFKTAEVLAVLPTGEVETVSSPASRVRPIPGGGGMQMSPGVAWRAVGMPDGSALIVHQRGQDAEVVLSEPTPLQPSSYGGGGGGVFDPCSPSTGIVESAVSRVGVGATATTGALPGVLPVDVAVGNGQIAVALAGGHDPDMPQPFVRIHDREGDSDLPLASDEARPLASILLMPVGALSPRGECGPGSGFFASVPPVIAVAFRGDADGQLVAQSREPSALFVLDTRLGGRIDAMIALGGDSRLDTGHEIFHRDTGAGIACASCHPEGTEDGRVWRFSGLGPRRTQALDVGLGGTAPFHWDGQLRDLGALMNEVFVGRMGGVRESRERLDALEGWLFAQAPRSPIVAADDPRVARGRAVFESAGCGDCHAGASFTAEASFDVGTGGRFQVPSLRGVGYRAPFLHTGCAEDLAARFDNPDCAGAAHGGAVAPEDVGDIVAYLESL